MSAIFETNPKCKRTIQPVLETLLWRVPGILDENKFHKEFKGMLITHLPFGKPPQPARKLSTLLSHLARRGPS